MNIPIRQYLALLATYLRPHARKMTGLCLLLAIGTVLALVNPQIVRLFIDTARAGGSLRELSLAAILFLVFGLVERLCAAGTTYLGADIGWLATNRLRADLARHCLYLDMPFHHLRTPGEMIERIDGDVNTLSNFFSEFLVRIASSVIILLGVLGILFGVDWRVGLVMSAFTLISAVTLFRLPRLAVPFHKAEREASAAQMGFIEERLGGIDDIRANGAGAYAMRSFISITRNLYLAARKAWLMRSSTWFASMTLFILGNLAALAMGAYLYNLHAITLGTVYLVSQYTIMLRDPLEQITRQLQDLQQVTAGILRVQELLQQQSAIVDGPGANLPVGSLAVDFDQVTFAYGDGEPVLREITFSLAPGRLLGVLGRTGSGKTTLTRLLFRLYDPAAGRIRLGGVDLHDFRLEELRQHIGMVTQDVQLFYATVRDNLTFFNSHIPDARIYDVLEELGLREWVDAMPQGLDTVLQAGGSGLSAGEAQLLAFIRVFLENPGLVLLDEPSSRLDPATERLLNRAVARLLRDRTGLIIAHRLSTVQRADEILILDDSAICEYGLREVLEADPASRFSGLLRTGLEKELV